MPEFKAPKDRLTLLLEANASGDFKLKPMLFTILKILGPPNNYATSTPPVLSKRKNKAWITAHLFTTQFIERLVPPIEACYLGLKKRFLKYCSSLTMPLVT